jgi:hypothetical protein
VSVGGGNLGEFSRREVLAAGAALGAAFALGDADGLAALPGGQLVRRIEFSGGPDGPGWGSGWQTAGVANTRRSGGEGLLEAGSDVFPNDPRRWRSRRMPVSATSR